MHTNAKKSNPHTKASRSPFKKTTTHIEKKTTIHQASEKTTTTTTGATTATKTQFKTQQRRLGKKNYTKSDLNTLNNSLLNTQEESNTAHVLNIKDPTHNKNYKRNLKKDQRSYFTHRGSIREVEIYTYNSTSAIQHTSACVVVEANNDDNNLREICSNVATTKGVVGQDTIADKNTTATSSIKGIIMQNPTVVTGDDFVDDVERDDDYTNKFAAHSIVENHDVVVPASEDNNDVPFKPAPGGGINLLLQKNNHTITNSGIAHGGSTMMNSNNNNSTITSPVTAATINTTTIQQQHQQQQHQQHTNISITNTQQQQSDSNSIISPQCAQQRQQQGNHVQQTNIQGNPPIKYNDNLKTDQVLQQVQNFLDQCKESETLNRTISSRGSSSGCSPVLQSAGNSTIIGNNILSNMGSPIGAASASVTVGNLNFSSQPGGLTTTTRTQNYNTTGNTNSMMMQTHTSPGSNCNNGSIVNNVNIGVTNGPNVVGPVNCANSIGPMITAATSLLNSNNAAQQQQLQQQGIMTNTVTNMNTSNMLMTPIGGKKSCVNIDNNTTSMIMNYSNGQNVQMNNLLGNNGSMNSMLANPFINCMTPNAPNVTPNSNYNSSLCDGNSNTARVSVVSGMMMNNGNNNSSLVHTPSTGINTQGNSNSTRCSLNLNCAAAQLQLNAAAGVVNNSCNNMNNLQQQLNLLQQAATLGNTQVQQQQQNLNQNRNSNIMNNMSMIQNTNNANSQNTNFCNSQILVNGFPNTVSNLNGGNSCVINGNNSQCVTTSTTSQTQTQSQSYNNNNVQVTNQNNVAGVVVPNTPLTPHQVDAHINQQISKNLNQSGNSSLGGKKNLFFGNQAGSTTSSCSQQQQQQHQQILNSATIMCSNQNSIGQQVIAGPALSTNTARAQTSSFHSSGCNGTIITPMKAQQQCGHQQLGEQQQVANNLNTNMTTQGTPHQQAALIQTTITTPQSDNRSNPKHDALTSTANINNANRNSMTTANMTSQVNISKQQGTIQPTMQQNTIQQQSYNKQQQSLLLSLTDNTATTGQTQGSRNMNFNSKSTTTSSPFLSIDVNSIRKNLSPQIQLLAGGFQQQVPTESHPNSSILNTAVIINTMENEIQKKQHQQQSEQQSDAPSSATVTAQNLKDAGGLPVLLHNSATELANAEGESTPMASSVVNLHRNSDLLANFDNIANERKMNLNTITTTVTEAAKEKKKNEATQATTTGNNVSKYYSTALLTSVMKNDESDPNLSKTAQILKSQSKSQSSGVYNYDGRPTSSTVEDHEDLGDIRFSSSCDSSCSSTNSVNLVTSTVLKPKAPDESKNFVDCSPVAELPQKIVRPRGKKIGAAAAAVGNKGSNPLTHEKATNVATTPATAVSFCPDDKKQKHDDSTISIAATITPDKRAREPRASDSPNDENCNDLQTAPPKKVSSVRKLPRKINTTQGPRKITTNDDERNRDSYKYFENGDDQDHVANSVGGEVCGRDLKNEDDYNHDESCGYFCGGDVEDNQWYDEEFPYKDCTMPENTGIESVDTFDNCTYNVNDYNSRQSYWNNGASSGNNSNNDYYGNTNNINSKNKNYGNIANTSNIANEYDKYDQYLYRTTRIEAGKWRSLNSGKYCETEDGILDQ